MKNAVAARGRLTPAGPRRENSRPDVVGADRGPSRRRQQDPGDEGAGRLTNFVGDSFKFKLRHYPAGW
jgi:hypothetical protein